ncbi:MAG: hypothetical protein OEQ39_22810 [Gammaproteobacteria bacterium]|nr:hypothetical protein [Gammaproteobacteria bacterium]
MAQLLIVILIIAAAIYALNEYNASSEENREEIDPQHVPRQVEQEVNKLILEGAQRTRDATQQSE